MDKYKVMVKGSPLFVTTDSLKDAEKMAKEHKMYHPWNTIIKIEIGRASCRERV